MRGQRAAAQSLRELAEALGVPEKYLDQLKRSLRSPSAMTLKALAGVVTFSGRSLAMMADLLDQQQDEDEDRVSQAIKHDRALSPRQREVLLQLYQSFLRAKR